MIEQPLTNIWILDLVLFSFFSHKDTKARSHAKTFVLLCVLVSLWLTQMKRGRLHIYVSFIILLL